MLSAKKLKEEVSANKRKLSVSVPLPAVLSLETDIWTDSAPLAGLQLH